MRPSLDLQYRVQDLLIENVLVFIIKYYLQYLSNQERMNLKQVSEHYNEMILDVLELRSVDFLSLENPRLDYAD